MEGGIFFICFAMFGLYLKGEGSLSSMDRVNSVRIGSLILSTKKRYLKDTSYKKARENLNDSN